MQLIDGCGSPAADASSNAGKANCLLVDHGRATWGYKVVSPNREEFFLETLVQQHRDLRTSRQSVTRSCTKAWLLTTQSQFLRMLGTERDVATIVLDCFPVSGTKAMSLLFRKTLKSVSFTFPE